MAERRDPEPGPETAAPSPVRRLADAVWHDDTGPQTLTGVPSPVRPRYQPRPQLEIEEEREVAESVDAVLRVGVLFLSAGAPTEDVEAAVFAVGAALGLTGMEVDVTYQSLVVSVPGTAGHPATSTLRVVRRRSQHTARLAAAHSLVIDLGEGRLDRVTFMRRLDDVEQTRRPYPRWFVTFAWGTLAAAVVLRLGGGVVGVLVALVTAAVVDRLGRVLSRRAVPPFFLNALGAFISTMVAVGLTAADVEVESALVVAGGIIALLPGMSLVVATQEAIGGFLVTAGARFVDLTVATGGIVTGVVAGLLLAGKVGVTMDVVDDFTPDAGRVTLAVVAAGVAAAALAVGYQSPVRTLVPAGATGALGVAVLIAVDQVLETPAVAIAISAAVVGLVAHSLAAWQRVPPMCLVVPGIVSMLPGLTLYQALLLYSQGDQAAGGLALLEAVTVGVGIAAGVLFGEVVGNPLRRLVRHGARSRRS